MLANVESNSYWTDTMLHELGHGVYDVGIDGSLPWLLRTPHLIATEGVAMLFGRLARDTEWLARVAEVDAAELAPLTARLPRAQAAALLVFARWVLVVTTFEHGMYADPEADHDTRWWELVQRFQRVTPPERPPRARLGREGAPRGRAGLLPELPLRRDDRLAAPRHTRSGGRRARRAAGGGAPAGRAGVSSGGVAALGPSDRGGDGRAALTALPGSGPRGGMKEARRRGAASARTRVRRLPEKARYDRATIDAILDEALVAHLGFVHEGQPFVIPTLHARVGDVVYVHGSAASRTLRELSAVPPACLTVTLLDGLVLARSIFEHSINYRSVVVLGTAARVTDRDEQLRALEAFSDQLLPGRWADVSRPRSRSSGRRPSSGSPSTRCRRRCGRGRPTMVTRRTPPSTCGQESSRWSCERSSRYRIPRFARAFPCRLRWEYRRPATSIEPEQ